MINNLIDSMKGPTQTSSSLSKDVVVTGIQKKAETTRVQDPVKTETGDTFSKGTQENKNKLNDTVKKINDELKDKNIQLSYFEDKETGQMVVQVKDIITNEVVRQMPTKQMLAVSQGIDDFMKSYDKKGQTPKTSTSLPILDDIA